MKHVYFLFLFFISNVLLAQSTCVSPSNSLSKQADNLNAVRCAEVNQKYVCKEVKVDPNELRNNMTKALDNFSKPERVEKYRTNWKSEVANAPFIAKFFAPHDEFAIQNKSAPIPVATWLSDQKFAQTGITDENMKKVFVDKYVAFSEKMGCRADFKVIPRKIEHPFIQPVSVNNMSREERDYYLSKMKKDLNDPAMIKKTSEFIKNYNAKSLSSENKMLYTFSVCNDKPLELEKKTTVRELYPPCGGNFKKYFPDNEYTIGPKELGRLMVSPEGLEMSSCIKSRTAQGAKVQFVDITSSASALNNTANAARKFCKKGFEDLSKARAEEAQNKILPELFKAAGVSQDTSKSVNPLNFKGTNGNGTSGSCVYENGSDVPKPYYKTPEGIKELDAQKYVKVQVTFEAPEKAVTTVDYQYRPDYACRAVEFFCPKTK